MKIITIFFNDIKKNSGGFTLIELVMTIILIGILSIGLYQVVMWGINDYLTNEEYLHSNNSMTYAMTVIRRNLENAAMPPATPLRIRGGVCPLNRKNYPSKNSPITVSPSEVAFYQNVEINGATTQQLVVFCVNPNNNALYKEVTTTNGTTASYPVADNISGINF